MIVGGGLLGLLLVAFWVWAIFDVIATEADRCRNLPKLLWLVLVILLTTIGAAAWLMLGRPRKVAVRLSSPSPAVGADPDADADRRRREHYEALDAELDRRLEEKKRNPPPETQPPST